jgi:Na+-transporting NADH:ubiquinone oxidoreductase subunit A
MGQTHVIKKGLDLPIKGQPKQVISEGASVSRVALIADDYNFMKPKMLVKVGDTVKRGEALFEDRKNPGVLFTSPGAGEVVAVNRGEKRRLVSVVIQLSEAEQRGEPGQDELQSFEAYEAIKGGAAKATDEQVRALLIESGLWTSLRRRPLSTSPAVDGDCGALFVTAIDSNPLAADVNVVLEGKRADFQEGLIALTALTQGPVYVCQGEGTDLSAEASAAGAQVETFVGAHPAGLVGTHIHTLYPVNRSREAWHIGYQDVVSVGRLFKTGQLDVERVVALCGPAILEPQLVKTRAGAEVAPLVEGNLPAAETRLIDGSAFYGRTMTGDLDQEGYLGRFRQQVTGLLEGRNRDFLGWLAPGGEKFSITRAYFSSLMSGEYGNKRRLFDFTTSTNGSHRAMVPIGMYEKVMPLDIMPTFLLRALLKDDLERAEALGCLELDEEDLALCTFASPGKEDYGVALRRTLYTIWKEG